MEETMVMLPAVLGVRNIAGERRLLTATLGIDKDKFDKTNPNQRLKLISETAFADIQDLNRAPSNEICEFIYFIESDQEEVVRMVAATCDKPQRVTGNTAKQVRRLLKNRQTFEYGRRG